MTIKVEVSQTVAVKRPDSDVGTVGNLYRIVAVSEMQLQEGKNVVELEESIANQIIHLNEYEKNK